MFEPLAGALSDQAPEVREKAAIWLGRLKDSRAFEPLMGAMNEKSGAVRAAAVRSLGWLGDARAVKPLLDALSDDEFVQQEANQALIELGDPEPETRLSTAISSSSLGLRLAAALDLANRHDRRALAPLADVLTQSWDGMKYDHKERKSAIEGLLKFRDADAVPALLFAVGDDDFEVKVVANQALIALGDPQPFERLSRVIEFRHIDEKAALRQAYQRTEPNPEDAKRWMAEDLELRLEAVKALGKSGDLRGIPLFLEVLDSGNEEMRETANQALIDLGDPEPYDRLAKLIRYPGQLGASAAAQLAERGGVCAIEILSRALTDDDPEVKLKAASWLITLSDAPKFDALLILLYDGETWQRKKAAEALGALGDLRAVRPLLGRLCDPDREVRDTASTALMELGDPEPEKHRAVLREQQHDHAIEVLEDWEASGELESIHAVRTLCQLGDPDASSVLKRVMRQWPSDDLAYEVIVALGKLGDPSAIHMLMKPMVDEDAWSVLRGAAEQAVTDIVNKERESGLGYLLEELQYGESVQIAAARLLGELGDESVVEDLKGLTQEEDFNVRAAAEKALQRLESRGISVGTRTELTLRNRIELAGVIQSIELPEGWSEITLDHDSLSQYSVRSFSSPDAPEVLVKVVLRLCKLHLTVGANLAACLSHERTLDQKELDGIIAVLGILGDPKAFMSFTASVEGVNGQKVVWLRGNLANEPYTVNVCFARSASDEYRVEEFWCIAPNALWSRYEPLFATITRSIEWNSG
ncbi:MAG: HEAT repeat domain-containing protein [Bryobacteraceae bacterium]